MTTNGKWKRRSVLLGGAVAAGAATAVPLLGGAFSAQADPVEDADALYKAGKFEKAARAYEEILKKDPKNVHAARQRGHIGLISNKFPEAEKYLKMALELEPDNKDTNQFLGDCYIRQDKFSQSIPHWEAIGEEIYVKWFGAFSGKAYQVHGDSARLPFQKLDPIPTVEGSVNGGEAKEFGFYTGAPSLGIRGSLAREMGLKHVAKQKMDFLDGVIWAYYGVLESFKLGGIELRNLPVGWSEWESGGDVETDTDGLIGTWILSHLLPTFDYAGRSLILRPKTAEAAKKARAAAKKAGVKPLPLWQWEHNLESSGSINDSGTKIMSVNFGGTSEPAAGMAEETAEMLGVRIDRDRPIESFGHSHPAVIYPCYPKEIRIGDAVAKNSYCFARKKDDGGGGGGRSAPHEYDSLGHFAHSFWKPYNITVDFTNMNLYIAHGKAA